MLGLVLTKCLTLCIHRRVAHIACQHTVVVNNGNSLHLTTNFDLTHNLKN